MRVQRRLIQEYYGVDGVGGTVFTHMKNGVVKLSEAGNADVESSSYIGDKNSSAEVTGYGSVWDFDMETISGDPVCEDMREIAEKQKSGEDCVRQLVSVDLTKPYCGNGTYLARRFFVSVECAPPSGDPRKVTHMSGKLNQIGAMTKGFFSVSQKKFYSPFLAISPAYKTTVPMGAKSSALLERIGGKTVVWNQMVRPIAEEDYHAMRGTISVENGVITATNLSATWCGAETDYFVKSINGHKYYVEIYAKVINEGDSATIATGAILPITNLIVANSTEFVKNEVIITANADKEEKLNICNRSSTKSFAFKGLRCYDLTQMFGAGNEPSSVDDERIKAIEAYAEAHPAQNAGELLSACVDKVVTLEDDGVTVLGEYAVPAAVQALTGYGWAVGDEYNYVDYEKRKLVKSIGKRAYQAGDETDTSVLTDMTNTLYALSEPSEVDISQYISGAAEMAVEPGGVIELHQSGMTMEVTHRIEYKIESV